MKEIITIQLLVQVVGVELLQPLNSEGEKIIPLGAT